MAAGGPKARKPRRSYNCGPCKKQKIKCDTQTPCSACIRHNRVDQCLAAPPNPASVSGPKIQKINLSVLSDVAVARPGTAAPPAKGSAGPSSTLASKYIPINPKPVPLHPALSSRASSAPPKPHPQPPVVPSTVGSGTAASAGVNTGSTALTVANDNEVSSLRNKISYLNDKLYSLETQLKARTSSSGSSSNTALGPAAAGSKNELINFNVDLMLRFLPNDDSLNNLILFYINFMNQPFNIIDSKLISSRLSRLSQLKQNINYKFLLNDEDYESIALISIICAIAILHLPLNQLLQLSPMINSSVITTTSSSTSSSGSGTVTSNNTNNANNSNTNNNSIHKKSFEISKKFLTITQNCLALINYKKTPKLIHLKILLILNDYYKISSEKNLNINLNTEIISIAFILNLQKSSIPQNSLEIEIQSNIWWNVVLNDQLNSITNYFPPFIKLDQINTNVNYYYSTNNSGSSNFNNNSFNSFNNSFMPDHTSSTHNSNSSLLSNNLKAFIPVEVGNNFKTIFTHFAKIIKLLNDLPILLINSKNYSKFEFFQNLILIDRQLTSLHIPSDFLVINERNNNTLSNFQNAHLQFLILFFRFNIFKSIFFNVKKNSDIWYIMNSILQNFFNKYMDLKRSHEINNEFCTMYYIPITKIIIVFTFWNLLTCLNMEFLNDDYKINQVQLRENLQILITDLNLLLNLSFNLNVEYYKNSIDLLNLLHNLLVNFEINDSINVNNFLKNNFNLFQSFESEFGIIPNNEFLNDFISMVPPHDFVSNNNFNNLEKFKLNWDFLINYLNDSQLDFLQSIGV